MPAVGLRASVAPIPTEPSPVGLLGGCVPVVVTGDPHELNGTDAPAPGCGGANPWQDCPPLGNGWTNPAAKIFAPVTNTTFEPVTAYAGAKCSAFGLSFEDLRASAMEQLRMGEAAVLEEWFMRRGLSPMAFGNDLTPAAGAVHIVSGIGLLETWLGSNYGGRGLIHVPVGAVSLLGKNHQFRDRTECLTTWAGNGVIGGSGYSVNVGPGELPGSGTEAPAGEAWLYVTGAMRIRRSARHTPQDNEGQGLNTVVNDRFALAESTFVPEVACQDAAAVRVTLSPCCT